MNIEFDNNTNQLEIYEEFKKYCKYYGEELQEKGVKSLSVQTGYDDRKMKVAYIPVSSGLSGPTDSLYVDGMGSSVYNSVEELLEIGYERLGENSFLTKEEVKNIDYSNTDITVSDTKHR